MAKAPALGAGNRRFESSHSDYRVYGLDPERTPSKCEEKQAGMPVEVSEGGPTGDSTTLATKGRVLSFRLGIIAERGNQLYASIAQLDRATAF